MVKRIVEWCDHYQVPLYLGAMFSGAVAGLWFPGAWFDYGVQPSLMMLLYATFMAVPFRRILESFTDIRFLASLLFLNFVVVPCVVYVLTRHIADDAALLIGVLFVLLTPCVDYVMVFTRLAGGHWQKILAATPLLLLLQFLFLPVYLALMGAASVMNVVEWRPFAYALVALIVIPLGLSMLTQRVSHTKAAMSLQRVTEQLMVPFMMLTLFFVVASHAEVVASQLASIMRVIPSYCAFLVVMPAAALVVSRLGSFGAGERRALAFSCSTRNSLVVLPLVLALPATLDLAVAVVVTQTLVELVGMIVFVRLFPKLIVDPVADSRAGGSCRKW